MERRVTVNDIIKVVLILYSHLRYTVQIIEILISPKKHSLSLAVCYVVFSGS